MGNAGEWSCVVGPGVAYGLPAYQANGKNCLVLRVETPLTRRLSGLLLIHNDLQYARDALAVFKETCLDASRAVVNQALWSSVIISYGKCFAEARGRKIKLEKKDHLQGASKEELAAHDELIALRNQYVAHAGMSLNERADIWIALDPDVRSLKAVFETLMSAFSTVPERVERYLGAVNRVLGNVAGLIEKQWASVEQHIDSVPIDEWYAQIVASGGRTAAGSPRQQPAEE